MNPRPRKPRGGSNSQMTKLKVIWLTLSLDERAYWQALFLSADSQKKIRDELLVKFQVTLNSDCQMNTFRDWEMDQRERDLEAERQQEDERRFMLEHPEWSLDEARAAVLKKAYLRANADGDFKLGLAVLKHELDIQANTMDREKLELLKCKAAQADSAKDIIQAKGLTEEEKKIRMYALFGVQ